jgi:hypothetical protein
MTFRLILMVLGLGSLTPTGLLPQSALSPADRARLAEVTRLVASLAERIWPGWQVTPFALLLVTDSAEYLLGHPRPTSEFGSPLFDSMLGMDVRSRPRVFAPTLLATFPAVGGLPTIVVGTAERTGKSSTDWVLTLLHEHFHQWQYSRPDYYRRAEELELAAGDSSGMWMLNYPFPYDSGAVQAAARKLARALARALDTGPRRRRPAIQAVIRARAALAEHLTAAETRYLEFQLWQEGVARFIEYTAAELASRSHRPGTAYKSLSDYTPYANVSRQNRLTLKRELHQLDLGKNRRISFYSLGAAYALLLDSTQPGWKQVYESTPFVMTALLKAGE